MSKGAKALGKGLLGQTPAALRPDKMKQIKKQSKKLVKSIYKPALHEINAERKQVQSIYDKRESDNQYYLDWLESQSSQLASHGAAADMQLQQSQQQIQQASAQAMQELRSRLVAEGAATPGNVSDPNQASAFNLTPEAQAGQSLIAAERQRTSDSIASGQQQNAAMAASNFALQQSSSIRNQGERTAALTELRDAKRGIKLERAAATKEEIARRLDQEIAKAQSVVDMRNMAAQLALGLNAPRLQKQQLAIDDANADADRRLDRRGQNIDDANADADRRQEGQQANADRRDENRDDRRETRQERREAQKEFNTTLNDAVSTIQNDTQIQHLYNEGGPQAVAKFLKKKGIVEDGLVAHIAAYYVGGQKIDAGLRERLRAQGLRLPKYIRNSNLV